MTTTHGPRPSPSTTADLRPSRSLGPTIAALVVGLLVSIGLLIAAALASMCSLWGETCTSAEESRISLYLVGAVVTFLGVPTVVAILRRDARWLFVPVGEAGIAVTIDALVVVF